jgi:hypothetical protein
MSAACELWWRVTIREVGRARPIVRETQASTEGIAGVIVVGAWRKANPGHGRLSVTTEPIIRPTARA